MRNFALCLKDSEDKFKVNKKYEAGWVYNGFIDVLSEQNELIKVSIDNSDFIFVLNCPEGYFIGS